MNRPGDRPIPVVALTGGIASGKTAVSDLFAALGVPVIDTDLLARELVAPGSEGLEAVVAAFGESVLDAGGALDRAAVRRRIFANADERERLEQILHPRIRDEVERRLEELDIGTPYALVVVPLLAETGFLDDADRILVVDVPEETQIERLVARDGVDERQARAALAAQAGRAERLARADDVIENTAGLAELRRRVEALHLRYLDLFR